MAPPPGLMLCEFFDSGGLASDADGLAQSDTAAEIPAESGDDAERGRGQEDEKQVLPQKCFHDPPPDDDCPLGPKRRSTSVMIRLASGARICPRFTRTPSTSTIIREIRLFAVRLSETARPSIRTSASPGRVCRSSRRSAGSAQAGSSTTSVSVSLMMEKRTSCISSRWASRTKTKASRKTTTAITAILRLLIRMAFSPSEMG